jgi:hypothetical protein
LRDGGYLSYIVPNTLVLNLYAKNFRAQLLQRFELPELLNFSDVDIFEGATVRTIIPVLRKSSNRKRITAESVFSNFSAEYLITSSAKVSAETLIKDDDAWRGAAGQADSTLFKKIKMISVRLSEILEISQGLIPYDKYRGHDKKTIENRIWHADFRKDKTFKKELRGGDISRYHVEWNGNQWISYGNWLAAPRKPEYFKQPRLLFREITDPKTGLLHVGYTDQEFYNNPSIINCISKDKRYSLFYLLGVCNSKLVAYLHYSFSPKAKKGVFPKILVNDVRNILIPRISFEDTEQMKLYEEITKLARSMVDMKTSALKALTDGDQNYFESRFADADRKVDALVYDLYKLNQKEILTIESAAKPLEAIQNPNKMSTDI